MFQIGLSFDDKHRMAGFWLCNGLLFYKRLNRGCTIILGMVLYKSCQNNLDTQTKHYEP